MFSIHMHLTYTMGLYLTMMLLSIETIKVVIMIVLCVTRYYNFIVEAYKIKTKFNNFIKQAFYFI